MGDRDGMTKGERAIVASVIGSAIAVMMLLSAIVSPLRAELKEHEKMWAHEGSANVVAMLNANIADLRDEIRLLRREIRGIE